MTGGRTRPALFALSPLLLIAIYGGVCSAQYHGKLIGKLSELHHGVSGEVYAVDGRTLFIKDFTYDGQGPAAYFYAGNTRTASSAGFRLRDENGSPEVLRRYRKEGVTITLPEGKTLNNIKIFFVWCEEFEIAEVMQKYLHVCAELDADSSFSYFQVNFGDVKIPRNFDYPRPQKIEPLKGVHAISSDNIVIVDAQTLLIPNLSYDGEAPDAKFWVGRGPKPSPQGVRVPDENGKELPLRRYDRKTVVLTLPGDLTVFDIGHFGIWCEAFTVDFGHLQIPPHLNVPPSLKMLGVSPQSKLNCEVLYDDLAFEVRWAIAGDSIVLQLVSKLDDREYMSFGLSGDEDKSVMIGGDVVVAWVDKETLKGYAEDYYLEAKSQCSGPSGSCPDHRLAENTNNIRLLNAAMVNGYSIVTYQRPLKPSDQFDKQIHTNKTQAIIWAIGPLNQRNEVSFHTHYPKKDYFLDFGRQAKWNCPMPESEQPSMRPIEQIKVEADETSTTVTSVRSRNSERRRGGNTARGDSEKSATSTRSRQQSRGSNRQAQRGAVRVVPTPAPASSRNAWEIPPIQCYEPEDGVFYAQMGPTGGKRGYPAITGHVGWGISWYINGLLIPEVNVVRGKTYTFVVEGGFDPDVPAKYHPFYITDDSVGGFEHKTDEEKKNVRIFAGIVKEKDGSAKPVGTGRLCHWTQTGDEDADDFESFGAYQRTLELKCDQGEPGVIQWTPDKDTPDTVYYQCFTHRYLGWKINVHDSCDVDGAASELKSVIAPAPLKPTKPDELSKSDDLAESPSLRVETRVKPNDITNEDKEDKDKSPVSEKTPIDPPQGQPQQLPNEPFLFQPQQSFFNPPVYMSHGPFFAQNTYNPYMFENPFYINPYQQAFKPSPVIHEDSTRLQATPEKLHESTTLPTTSTTTTTTTTTTSTEKTNTEFDVSKFTDKYVALPTDVRPNETLFFPPVKMNYQPNFINKPAIRRPVNNYQGYRPFISFPMKSVRHTPPRLIPPQKPYKKQVYRPMMNTMPGMRPHVDQFPFKLDNLQPPFLAKYQKRTPNYIILKPQVKMLINPTPLTIETSTTSVSTEREPEIQTAPPSAIKSPINRDVFHMYRLPPALNTGFHPESVVIESGFKPIVSKEFQRRMSDDEPEIEYQNDIGVVDLVRNSPQEYFEPMFVPSPIDKKINKTSTKKTKLIIKPRSLEEETNDTVAEAAERIDSYYLPPIDRTDSPMERPQHRSNIDLESPPDTVVTYDGRKLSGASLTVKPADRSNVLDLRASKAAELIKTRPQFVPFRGELPPLDPVVINSAGQLQTHGVISRELDSPPKTKLVLVRKERAAHHTPEHTAEQAQQTNNTAKGGTTSGLCKLSHFSVMLVAYFLKYI